MSINSTMANAFSGLTAASRAAELVARNVANATTEGYAAKSLQPAQRILGSDGAGVNAGLPQRAGDPILTAERRRADSIAASADFGAQATRKLANLLGQPGEDTSLSAQFVAFENAVRALADTPESPTLQATVAERATTLTRSFNMISTDARRVRIEADADVKRQVDTVNAALAKVEQINRQIQSATANNRDATSLEDERQRQLDLINSIVPIRSTPREGGSVTVTTLGGATLLDVKAQKLDFQPTALITEGMDFETGDLSRVSILGLEGPAVPTPPAVLPPGTPAVSRLLAGGSLEAAIKVRDEIAPQFTRQIDALARDLISRFQDPAVDPTIALVPATPPALDAPGLFTDRQAGVDTALAPFDPLNPDPGLAGRISLNAIVGGDVTKLRDGIYSPTSGPAGASAQVTRLLDALTAEVVPGVGLGFTVRRDAAGMAETVISISNVAAARAEGDAAFLQGSATTLRDAETEISAVDVDKEMQSLLIIEKAFAANARVIQVADDLLRQILEI